jgi:hypothetical protein
MKTRNGKIARLPLYIRNELNRRLQDGEPGVTLVGWLNGRKDVQEVLQEEFGGRAVTEQNLSEWKQGGYEDWLRHEEARAFVQNLAEQSDELDETADGLEISDRFASVLAAEMTRLAELLLERETDPEKRWQRLREIHRELSQLRHDDHRAVRTLIKRESWKRQTERVDEERLQRLEKEHRQKLCAPFWARLQLGSLAELFGGGELGREIAAFILECQHGLPPGKLDGTRCGNTKSPPAVPTPTESNPIQPNQTN